MFATLPQALRLLARECPSPLYLVGGYVRDALAGAPCPKPDLDLASAASDEAFARAAERCGFTVRAVYPATGTVKIADGQGMECEYTRFRSDKYVRGIHTPAEVCFTEDIALDARRRDFCANAVYYDLAADTLCDPLGGIQDISARVLRTGEKRVEGGALRVVEAQVCEVGQVLQGVHLGEGDLLLALRAPPARRRRPLSPLCHAHLPALPSFSPILARGPASRRGPASAQISTGPPRAF